MQNSTIITKIVNALSLEKKDIQAIYKLEDKDINLDEIDNVSTKKGHYYFAVKILMKNGKEYEIGRERPSEWY